MRKFTLPILPVLLAAVITGAVFAARPAHAQSSTGPIRGIRKSRCSRAKSRSSKRVDTLEGLDQKVKVIDRKLEVQQESAQADHQKALSMPVVTANENGFSLSSPNHDYNLN